jgi:uncharacterized protein YdhG (YjbR/CyaY superfamily)
MTTKAGKKGSSTGFTAEERAAMKERSRELRAAARLEKDRAAGERDVLAKIAEMNPTDRAMAKRVHAIIKETAPDLAPRTWYGMPAYTQDGKVVCHFKPAEKFNTRYATLGFSDRANLDDGALWPVEFALTKVTGPEEAKIRKLVKRAMG